ncbi:small-conductance mechanosensitive channel [Alcanivorax hongdengensis A-11-3]|uniref:Small-conductance mechanosensitive channel n=1 Tax=Alcanivorax hongdengensis A-11-3 TaxID=1177179 RepID=L0W9F1_9GAMM|nr:mechanosensitive ion channel domain-containing protein [Alcanivorax hongdengensis]EKF73581.1 small-conductance mechanosensitive channel [Alcanivorax hongdengensis A-11-3]
MDQYLSQLQTFANENLMPYAWNIVAALVIFIVGKWIVGRLANWSSRMLDKRVDATVAKFLGNIIHIILFAFVVIAALDQLGVETTSLVAILGAAGLAVGLALKDSLGNFAAGVMLILFKPFRVGQYVEAGGTAGTVKEIRIFATIFGTPDNKVVTVPNGSIMSGNIVNYSEMPTRRVDMVFGVGYDADLSLVKKTLQDILANDERVLKDPAPTIVVGELADSSVNFLCRPWVNSADYWGVFWDTTETVKRRFDEAGISIPFPQMDVHLDKQD